MTIPPSPRPNPRYRLYTDIHSYCDLIFGALAGQTKRPASSRDIPEALQLFWGQDVCLTPMGRVGAFLALKHHLKDRKKVITPAYTIADMINMIVAAGGEPVFADINRKTCNLDLETLEPCLQKHGSEVGAVFVTHLHGLMAPVIEIRESLEGSETLVIEDAAQALGAQVDGRRAGTIGDVGIHSFGTFKNVNGWYGGAVTGRPELLAPIAAELQSYPVIDTRFLVKRVVKGLLTDIATWPPLFHSLTFPIFKFGFLRGIQAINRFVETELDTSLHEQIPSRYLHQMSQAQLRLIARQIPAIDGLSSMRIRYAQLYEQGLKDIAELILPPVPACLAREGSDRSREHIYTYFPIQFEPRDDLLRFLAENNRDVAAQHLKNCASLPDFRKFDGACPVAEQVARSVILLPTYPRYGEDNVISNIEVIRRFFGKS